VFIRKQLSTFSEKSFESQLNNLSADNLMILKTALFNSLETESQANVRHQICDAIGEIGGSLQDLNKPWTDLLNNIFTLLNNSAPVFQECGLRIMTTHFEYQVEDYLKRPELFKAFEHFFANGSPEVRNQAISAFAALVGVLEPKEVRAFEPLVPSLIQASHHLML
jgi:importin-5